VAALATLVASGDRGPGSTALVGIGGAIVGVGVVVGRSVAGGRLERAWELEAIGLAVMAAGWLAGVGLGV
ncbi:MAG TPA: hypothetical protein VGO15_03600, partial [Candidatus Limnocylindrales bacterium]|nr:hypothetical protein [Candidatus Limnocylindrales bacterium]